ncbi:MAG: ATP-grasp domain-containing protein [Myxococcota bacterium]
MNQHVIFAAPFLLPTTARFISAATRVPGVALTLVSQDPAERLPSELRSRVAGHWRVDDALDPQQLVDAARALSRRFGPATRYMGALEQLQVPLALAREALGLPGLSVDAARNFRDKARMKTVLRAADVPCARHVLAASVGAVQQFVQTVGFPLIAKPPAGAGGKGTFRLEDGTQLRAFVEQHVPQPSRPVLLEEFVRGEEYSFDSVCIAGRMVWHSVSRYLPSPLEVMENPWIQWCVLLPRELDGFGAIQDAAARGLRALGLQTGLSHMEWFRLRGDRIAVSEVGARPPGAQITSLLSYAHDLDFYRAWSRLMIRDEFEPPARTHAVGAAYFRGQGRGKVARIVGLDEAQRRFGALVVESNLPYEGQTPSDSYEGDGFVILRHRETAVVEDALKQLVSLVRVELS